MDKIQLEPGMQQISATDAKQTFGDLLDAAARGPVAIEKYKKIKAIVAAPEFFARASQEQARLAERHMARLQQSLLDKDRFIQHQQIAVKLLTLPARERRALIEKAQAVVAQWQAERLCSSGSTSALARSAASAVQPSTMAAPRPYSAMASAAW
jgi:hypothetical protein